MAQEFLKCGNKWHAPNVQIPASAQVKTSPAGRPYYVSGLNLESDMAIIRFLDGDATEVKQVNRKLV